MIRRKQVVCARLETTRTYQVIALISLTIMRSDNHSWRIAKKVWVDDIFMVTVSSSMEGEMHTCRIPGHGMDDLREE
jgi:hypothetical protein